jgi:hypothetical protein
MGTIPSYTHFGGKHAETASLTNILRAQGVGKNQTLSEVMLLGIGGGLGAGYILWEFKEHAAKVLVFGWQNRWQYTMQFYEKLCKRINVTPTFQETGSQKTATNQLNEALDAGQPVVAWVDGAQMPYLQLPKSLEGHMGHFIAIYGREGNQILVDDLAAKPFRVPAEIMAAARARIGSYKNRLLLVSSNGEFDLAAAIHAGLQDCVDHLSEKSDSFSLATFQKWGKMMTHRKNAKGWPVVFANRKGLYGALKSVYEGVELVSTGGGGMRGLYADFLDEAAGIVNPDLAGVAKKYRSLQAQWTALAETALPDNIGPLRETKELLRQRYDILMTQGGDGLEQMQPLTEQLGKLYQEYNPNFPMNDAEIDGLFGTLGDQLLALYDAEVSALAALKEIVN